MTHTFIQEVPSVVKTALGLLEDTQSLAAMVYRDADADFAGKRGSTINVKRPSILEAYDIGFRVADRTVVDQELEESEFPLSLDQYPISAVALTDEEMTLDVIDFGVQVLKPQIDAVTRYVNRALAQEMITSTTDAGTAIAATASNILSKVTAAGTFLNSHDVPRDGRVLLAGSAVEEALVQLDKLTDVDTSGSSQTLREAILGRLRGFTVVGTNHLPANKAIAFHRTAFVLAMRAPIVPASVTGGGLASKGMALRWIKDYNSTNLSERSVVGTFMGTATILDPVDYVDPAGDQELHRAVAINLS